MFLNAIFLAFRQIRRNLLRAILTMLGIIIGVASVVIMITIGNGTSANITQKLSSLGSNILIVFPARGVQPGVGPRHFKMEDIEQLYIQSGALVRAIAPVADHNIIATSKYNNTQTKAQGANLDYFVATEWGVQDGREFNDNDYRNGSSVCLLGKSAAKNLFKEKSPLGEKVRILQFSCEVIGILEEKGQGAMGNDQDDVILLPLRTFNRSISKGNTLYDIKRIMISLKDGLDSQSAVDEISAALTDIRGIRAGMRLDFEIMDTKQILDTMKSTTATLTIFLGAIAGVSLIVGGIGIMNIMLVSITERTKEIGTRLAIGALQSEVLMQFLIESVVISALGGLIGLAIAFGGSFIACRIMELPFLFDLKVALIAFFFSGFIGVLFGYLPARRASRLNPIEALRHE